MTEFIIIKRYNHITLHPYWDRFNKVKDWCINPDNGKFTVKDNNIFYESEQDLSAFLLRWS